MTCVIFTMAMFLYPLWVLFVGALVVLLTGLFRKNSFFPSLLSFFVIASCALVLIPYLFFGRPRVIAGPGGIFLFVLDPVNTGFALCLSIICAGLIPQLAGRGAMEARNGEEGASILFSLGLAMGTIFSSDLLTMVFFAEAAYLFFFSMAKKRSYGVYFSVIHDGMFFLPTAAIIVILFFQGVTGGPDLLFAVETFELSCLVLVVYVLLRLLFFPFSLFSERMAGVLHEPLLAGLAIIAAFAGVSMTMKILVIGPGVSFAVLLISLMVAGIYSVLAYRQKDLGRLTACVFFIETACITATAGLQALMSGHNGQGTVPDGM